MNTCDKCMKHDICGKREAFGAVGLNRAGVESKFYSEGALGELNPTLKTVLDILKGISSVRGR